MRNIGGIVFYDKSLYLGLEFDRDGMLFGLEDEQVGSALGVAHLCPFFRYCVCWGVGKCVLVCVLYLCRLCVCWFG